VLVVKSENFDHADAVDTYKIAVEPNTGFDVVAETVADINYSLLRHKGYEKRTTVDRFGNLNTVICKMITTSDESCREDSDSQGGGLACDEASSESEDSASSSDECEALEEEDCSHFDVARVKPVVTFGNVTTKPTEIRSTKGGPYPPSQDTVLVDEEQYAKLVDLGENNGEEMSKLDTKVGTEHAATRTAIATTSGSSTAELNGLIVAESERNRVHTTTATASVQAAVLADTAILKSSVNGVMSRVQVVDSTTTAIANVQDSDSNRLLAVHEVVNGTTVQVEELQRQTNGNFHHVDEAHQAIISAINNIPHLNNYDLIKHTVSMMQVNYNELDLTDFRTHFNILLATFGFGSVVSNDYDVIIVHDKLKSYLSQGHLFPVNASSDVPMAEEDKPDYVWPNYNVAQPEELLGLYFRTQRAGIEEFPDTAVYTYFRINSCSEGKLFCSEHVKGEPALPRPAKAMIRRS